MKRDKVIQAEKQFISPLYSISLSRNLVQYAWQCHNIIYMYNYCLKDDWFMPICLTWPTLGLSTRFFGLCLSLNYYCIHATIIFFYYTFTSCVCQVNREYTIQLILIVQVIFSEDYMQWTLASNIRTCMYMCIYMP